MTTTTTTTSAKDYDNDKNDFNNPFLQPQPKKIQLRLSQNTFFQRKTQNHLKKWRRIEVRD